MEFIPQVQIWREWGFVDELPTIRVQDDWGPASTIWGFSNNDLGPQQFGTRCDKSVCVDTNTYKGN
jgi:hypothetical protein